MSRNPYFCVAIVVALASVAIVGVLGMVWLGVLGREPSQALVGITSAAVGALGGSLAVTPLTWKSNDNTNNRPNPLP